MHAHERQGARHEALGQTPVARGGGGVRRQGFRRARVAQHGHQPLGVEAREGQVVLGGRAAAAHHGRRHRAQSDRAADHEAQRAVVLGGQVAHAVSEHVRRGLHRNSTREEPPGPLHRPPRLVLQGHQGLDLAGALVDGQDERVAVVALDVVVLHDAVAAVDLHGRARDGDGALGPEPFHQRRAVAQRALEAGQLARPRRRLSALEPEDAVLKRHAPIDERAQGGHLGLHVQQHVRHHLVAGDGPAHLHAPLGVGPGGARGRLRHAEALDGHRDARLVHEGQDLGEPVPARSQQLRAGSFEAQLAGGGAADHVLLLRLRHAEVLAPVLHPRRHQQRQAFEPLRARLRARQHHADVPAAVGDELLPSRDAPVPALGDGGGRDVADVRSRVGLRHGHGARDRARGQPRHPALGLLARPEAHDGHGRALVEDVQQERVGAGAREDLAQEGARRHREVRAAQVPWQAHAHHAQSLEAVDVREQRRRVDDLALLEGHALGVDLPRARRDLARGVLPRHAQALAVDFARLSYAAGAVLEAEALLPQGDDVLPGNAMLEVELEVVVVGEEVHATSQ